MSVTRSEQAQDDALDIAVRQLQQFPRSGPQIALPQFPKLRCLAVPDFPEYFLFYLLNDGDVLIARVGDSRRDWSVILDEEV